MAKLLFEGFGAIYFEVEAVGEKGSEVGASADGNQAVSAAEKS